MEEVALPAETPEIPEGHELKRELPAAEHSWWIKRLHKKSELENRQKQSELNQSDSDEEGDSDSEETVPLSPASEEVTLPAGRK